jgi:hypothetical protein
MYWLGAALRGSPFASDSWWAWHIPVGHSAVVIPVRGRHPVLGEEFRRIFQFKMGTVCTFSTKRKCANF